MILLLLRVGNVRFALSGCGDSSIVRCFCSFSSSHTSFYPLWLQTIPFKPSLVADLDAEGLQALAGALADYRVVLTDGRREDHGIHLAPAGHGCPDIGLE